MQWNIELPSTTALFSLERLAVEEGRAIIEPNNEQSPLSDEQARGAEQRYNEEIEELNAAFASGVVEFEAYEQRLAGVQRRYAEALGHTEENTASALTLDEMPHGSIGLPVDLGTMAVRRMTFDRGSQDQ